MIAIKNFSVFASGKKVIEELNVTYNLNSINAVIGPNGCGKTTFLKGLCGLNKSEGTIYFNEKKLDPYTQKQDCLAAFLEGGSYYLNMTVYENLKYACLLNKIDLKKINDTLSLVNFPITHLHTKASKLSLGQRQKLGLAMTLILEKPILLLDEPLNGLDVDGVDGFNELLLKIKAESKTTILITSHLIEKLINITDTISILKDGNLRCHFNNKQIGKICFITTKETLFTNLLKQQKISFKEIKQGLLISQVDEIILKQLVVTAGLSDVTLTYPNLEEVYKYSIA